MKTSTAFCIVTLLALFATSVLQAKRPKPPVRSFDAPGAPKFIRLDDKPGVNPPVDAVGNFLIGPDYRPASERRIPKDAPRGKVSQFTIDSKTTNLLNPGIARKVFGTVDPKNPKTQVQDKEFYIEVRTILNQTKSGTYMFFNTGKMAPKILRPNSVKVRAQSDVGAEKERI